MTIAIPLNKLNCHHCKQWHKECPGIQHKDLDKTGDTYCMRIFGDFSEDSVDGRESQWLSKILELEKEDG